MTRLALLLAALLVANLFPLLARADDRAALETLTGTWADPAPYAYGPAFGQRVFTFDGGRWTLDFTLSLDPAGAAPVFRFRTLGAYAVTGPAALPDAWEATFTEEAKFLTLMTPDAGLAEAFGLAPCGLVPGIEADISATGCAAWKPVAECGLDHDLLALDEAGLRFGIRPADNDMCTPDRRPTALTPPVVRR